MLRPQQNYVYVLSRYLNSLVRTVVLVLCLTTVLLAVGSYLRVPTVVNTFVLVV